MAAPALTRDLSVLKPVQDNVNLSSSSSTTTKRLTMVERARLEALAAFGNEGLDSLSFKKTDLSSKLKSVTPSVDSKTANTRTLTRMEKARIEAATAFENVKLGQMIKNPRKRKMQDNADQQENSKKQNQIYMTRIQKAKQEAEKAFENVSLDKIPPKRSKLEKEKMEKRILEGKKESKPSDVKKAGRFKSHLPGTKPILKSSRALEKDTFITDIRSTGVTTTPKRLTRSHSEKMEALKCGNGTQVEVSGKDALSGENVNRKLSKNHEKFMVDAGIAMETTADNVLNITPKSYQANSIDDNPGKNVAQKKLTRLERAKLEALQSFAGQEFSNICKQSTRIVAKHLKPKKDQNCNTENEKLLHDPKHVPEPHNQDELKPQENFQLQVALLKVSEVAKTSPQVLRLKQKTPKVDFYSSIIEENFKNQSSLLETSRRVVKTAMELETPEGSPMSATTS